MNAFPAPPRGNRNPAKVVALIVASLLTLLVVFRVVQMVEMVPSDKKISSQRSADGAAPETPLPIKPKTKAELKKEAEQRRIEAANEEAAAETARKLFGTFFEQQLLDKGIDSTVTVSGPKHTTMTVKWIGMSRIIANQFNHDATMWQELRKQGFRKFVISDGYDFGWQWKL